MYFSDVTGLWRNWSVQHLFQWLQYVNCAHGARPLMFCHTLMFDSCALGIRSVIEFGNALQWNDWKNEERNDILWFSDFLVVNFCYFAKSIHPSFCCFFVKYCHNCLQYEIVLKIFLLSHFEYWQIWLYILMDDWHMSKITKLKKNHCFGSVGLFFHISDVAELTIIHDTV